MNQHTQWVFGKLPKTETLCWRCEKATGACEWSALEMPVPGWQVEPTWRKERQGGMVRHVPGKRVVTCPKFELDRRERQRTGR